MLATVILLSLTCGYVQSSGFHPVAVPGTAPVVTAASSQYFERIFNRLVAAPLQPVIPVAPAFPVIPAPPVVQNIPVVPSPPVVIDAKRTTAIPVNPTLPPQASASDPNVAIAIATAHAAAPVATILLPPYPFGFPPTFGFVPQTQQPLPTTSENPNNNNNRESTTSRTTIQVKTTTEREQQDLSTPVPSNIDNSFAQALPSNQNVNFKQYLAPPAQPRPPLPPVARPQKVKTNVEVVPVPLAYIAPPPLSALHHHHHHQHHHHHHQHQALKVVPHIHTFIPKTRIIVRPVTSYRIKAVKTAAGFAKYGPPKKIVKRYPQNTQAKSRGIKPTTYRPIKRSPSRGPRV